MVRSKKVTEKGRIQTRSGTRKSLNNSAKEMGESSNLSMAGGEDEPSQSLDPIGENPSKKRKSSSNNAKGKKIRKRGDEEESNDVVAEESSPRQGVEKVQFVEGQRMIEMEVEGQESEFLSEINEDSDDDCEVTFNLSQRSENNNASVSMNRGEQVEEIYPIEPNQETRRKFISERTDLPSHSSTISEQDKADIIGKAIGKAMEQVQEIFDKTGFIQMAAKLQDKLDQTVEEDAGSRTVDVRKNLQHNQTKE